MTVLAILDEIENEGVFLSISVTGNIKAQGQLSTIERWRESIRLNKNEILHSLNLRGRDWRKEQWHEFFNQRADIAQFNGKLGREHAEEIAFFCCVDQWYKLNPCPSKLGSCAHCNKTTGMHLPYLTSQTSLGPVHTWLHHECSYEWHTDRKIEALKVLNSMGLDPQGLYSYGEKSLAYEEQ